MEARLLSYTEINPEVWDAFVRKSPQGMIYASYAYVSAMAGEWRAIVVLSGDTWHAAMPFGTRRKGGFAYSLQPVFAHFWGVMFRPVEANISKAYEQRKHWLKLIIEAIPADIRLFSFNFSTAFDYPLPFYWKGYRLTPRYTFQIDLRKPEETLWSNLAENIRRDVRKAQKAGIRLDAGCEPDTVIAIFRRAKEAEVNPVSEGDYAALAAVVKHFFDTGESHTLVARTSDGQAVAGIIFFRWEQTCIYFFGSTEPEFKASGAMSLIIWEGIRQARQAGCAVFDFEGSMIEPVARFFQGFGSVPVMYLNISRDTLPAAIRLARRGKLALRKWMHRLRRIEN